MRYENNPNKLGKITLTKDNYYVVLDFDGTITSSDSLDSWMAIIDFEYKKAAYGRLVSKKYGYLIQIPIDIF